MIKILELLHFGKDTLSLVRSLQLNLTSKVLQDEYLSEKIALGRGCRQDDPIPLNLFVVAAEFLAEAVRTNTITRALTFF